MYSQDDLNAAVAAGALSQQAADALREHTARAKSVPLVDEEQFRLITGFNDIFVVIACLILLSSIGWLAGSLNFALGALAVAGSSWALAEFFTLKRRMALPSILLLGGFVWSVMVAFQSLGGAVLALFEGDPGLIVRSPSSLASVTSLAFSSLAGAVAAWLHWRRFKVPITIAAGALALVAGGYSVLVMAESSLTIWLTAWFLLSGSAIFIIALRWDASDPQRQSRNSDVAFWLHLLAAPLLVHPVFTLLGVLSGAPSAFQGIGVLAVYLLIAVVSLAIDRRAMMVSSLGYVLYTIAALLQTFGAIGFGFALTALVIGSALLLLSAFWQPCRQRVLLALPTGLRAWCAPLPKSEATFDRTAF